MRSLALRRWHVWVALVVVSLGLWWLLIEGALWAAAAVTGGRP